MKRYARTASNHDLCTSCSLDSPICKDVHTMISEKQLAANRANAQYSTGPRTLLGKSISRRNSLKEGYTGDGIVITAEEAQAVEDKYILFAEYIQPQNVVEIELVERMALASTRLDRSRRAEEARIEKRRLSLEKRFDRKRKKELQPTLEIFANDFKRGHALLLET